ncbi:hypothetical protein FOA52_010323 [Chlamydomonas sp. UWO 241]|nr:hypothetical protein FOA52_010323 [Chlamydomonas sp. UWO 241]
MQHVRAMQRTHGAPTRSLPSQQQLSNRVALATRAAPCRRRSVRAECSGRPVAVITGCSTGIGRATAQRLEEEGWDVFAGVRRPEDGAAVAKRHPNVTPVMLDVTDEASVRAAFKTVADAVGSRGVQGLVNNAGKVTIAPIEFMPVDVFNDMMQVNLVGAMRVTQAFLPLLRAGKNAGRIINISSQSGTVALPLFGGYNASKAGLESLSDVLRYELYEQGIKVVCIKPGPIKTPIWEKSFDGSLKLREGMPAKALELYGSLMDEVSRLALQASEANALPVEDVAEAVLNALTTPDPEPGIMMGTSATVQMVLRRYLPDTWWNALMTTMLFKGKGK